MNIFNANATCLSAWSTQAELATPIYVLDANSLSEWVDKASSVAKQWLKQQNFKAKPGQYLQVPDAQGHLAAVLFGEDPHDPMAIGALATQLPSGVYSVAGLSEIQAFAWALHAYQFSLYKEISRADAQLFVGDVSWSVANLKDQISAVAWGRDLINLPADDLNPARLAEEARALASYHEATLEVIEGQAELAKHFPAIHAVGRAADVAPRLIDLRWGDEQHFAITLVGKGVCFDTGGLNLKNTPGMATMKKDMGGAAHVLALAHMIMALKLPVCLRVLVPAVENAIGKGAYRPGDVVRTRSGKTVEITNTDAEGRMILSDALTYAQEQTCDWLIDVATLTGAARVALGTDLPGFFTNSESLSEALVAQSKLQVDPVWRLPLYRPYRGLMDTPIADIKNASSQGYGGAITAALFLQDFVNQDQVWMHFDLMAANQKTLPGRPEGGEIMGMRALLSVIINKVSE